MKSLLVIVATVTFAMTTIAGWFFGWNSQEVATGISGGLAAWAGSTFVSD